MRGGALVFAVLVAAPTSAAGQRALFDAEGIADASALRAALESSTGLELVDRAQLHRELEALAAELGDDPSESEAGEALRRAHRAYVELRLAEAGRAYGDALDALLSSDRIVASPPRVARLLFERSLLHLAARRRRDAQEDLGAALEIWAGLEPDREVYGAPVLELFDRARRTRGSARRLVFGPLPDTLELRVDGALVRGDVEVRGVGPHLVTLAGLGVRPRSILVEARARRTAVEIEVTRASGALLAAQILAQETPATLSLLLRATRVDRVVRVRAVEGALDVTLSAATGEVVGRAVGGLLPWEPTPYFVLAERVAGREVERPPPPAAAPTALAVAAPSSVLVGERVDLRVTLEDPEGSARTLRARCGDASITRAASPAATLSLRGPSVAGMLHCSVAALDALEEPLIARRLRVDVRAPSGDDAAWWVLGGSIVAAVATAAIVLGALLYQPSQVLVIEGID